MKACSVQKEANNGLSGLKGQHYLLGLIHRPSHWVGCLATCTMPCMQVHSPWVQMELPTLAWAPGWRAHPLSRYQRTGESWSWWPLEECAALSFQWKGEGSPLLFLKRKKGTLRDPLLQALIIHVSWFKNQAKNMPTFKSLFWQVKKKSFEGVCKILFIFWRDLQIEG